MPSSAASSFLFPPLLPLLMASFFFSTIAFLVPCLCIFIGVSWSPLSLEADLYRRNYIYLSFGSLSHFFFSSLTCVSWSHIYICLRTCICAVIPLSFFLKKTFFIYLKLQMALQCSGDDDGARRPRRSALLVHHSTAELAILLSFFRMYLYKSIHLSVYVYVSRRAQSIQRKYKL